VIERMLDGRHERLDIITGEGAAPVEALRAAVEQRHPGLELEVYDGGQPHYPLLLVAE